MLKFYAVRKKIFILLLISTASALVFRQAFHNFFAQDDFILISEFSQNGLLKDLANSVAPPKVTHWRPFHNFYFFLAGNLFNKNYFGYHSLTFIIHIAVAFLIFKIVKKMTDSFKVASISSFIYAIHSAHFVTLFWISGAATTIGFFFFLLSLYFFLDGKSLTSLISFIFSLLASEAMIVAVGVFVLCQPLFENKKTADNFLKRLLIVSGVFVVIRFLFLTPESTFDAYQINISPRIFSSLKYYLLRISGFAETSGDLVVSLILLGLLLFVGVDIFKRLKNKNEYKVTVFGLSLIILGLFPFVFISNLSPHYMNISVFGFATLFGFSVSKLKPSKMLTILAILFFVFFVNVNKTYENNWVIQRSNLAKNYIRQIENANLPEGSTIVFNDNYISSSDEAYIALGTGKAIDFWFPNNNYRYCFTAFENCENK